MLPHRKFYHGWDTVSHLLLVLSISSRGPQRAPSVYEGASGPHGPDDERKGGNDDASAVSNGRLL